MCINLNCINSIFSLILRIFLCLKKFYKTSHAIFVVFLVLFNYIVIALMTFPFGSADVLVPSSIDYGLVLNRHRRLCHPVH